MADPHVIKAMRSRHAERSELCPCDRRIYGNGRKSHQRACLSYLQEHGWPLADDMVEALFADGIRGGEVSKVQKKLAAYQIATQVKIGTMPWGRFKELVYRFADEVKKERD